MDDKTYYKVSWHEKHVVIVLADSKDEAIERANVGDVIGDESAEVVGGFEANITRY